MQVLISSIPGDGVALASIFVVLLAFVLLVECGRALVDQSVSLGCEDSTSGETFKNPLVVWEALFEATCDH